MLPDARGRARPVWARNRVGRLLGGLVDHARTAWWGLVSPRLFESSPPEIEQAVILREGDEAVEVLLAFRSDLFGWELPGGNPEPGESREETLIREVREETGLEIVPVRLVGRWVRRGFRPHVARVYTARIVGGSERPSPETPTLGWFDAQAPPSELFSWYREPLSRALDSDHDDLFEGEDWQGPTTVWHAFTIDLRMRWRGLPRHGPEAPARSGAHRADDG